MAIIKVGENLQFSRDAILGPKEALVDEAITRRFIKLAKKLKRLAPKSSDFNYVSCVMMHAAEAALVDQKTGKPILNKNGKPVVGCFEGFVNKKGQETVRWISEDGIKPYKNANGDIFGEGELKKAYKKWVGKPLCKDHISDSVDGIRGIIIDTYYDSRFKRVHALFALDRKNYGDLARKVETGYANCVSMGTAVGRAVCTECGNIATTEKEYCPCIQSRANYGEINLDLNPIELSLVVNGADGWGKIKKVIASINSYVQEKQARVNEISNARCVNPTELQALLDSVGDMQKKISSLLAIPHQNEQGKVAEAAASTGEIAKAIEVLQEQFRLEEGGERQDRIRDKINELIDTLGSPVQEDKLEEQSEPEPEPATPRAWPPTGGGTEPSLSSGEYPLSHLTPEGNRFASTEGGNRGAFDELHLLRSKVGKLEKELRKLNTKFPKEEKIMNSARIKARAKIRRAYWQGTEEPTPGKPQYEKEDAQSIRDKEDRQMTGTPLETGSDGLHPGDKELKEKLLRAKLEERKLRRRAYWLGTEEPTPGKPQYEKEDAESIRDKEDKQMTGMYDMGGVDGMVPADKPVKEKLLRAKLRARFVKAADNKGNVKKDASRWDIFAGDKLILSATAKEIYGNELNEYWDYLSSRNYGKDVIRHIRSEGFDRVAYLLKGAQPPAEELAAPPADPAAPMPEDLPADPSTEAMPPMEELLDAPAEMPQEGTYPEGDHQAKVDSTLSALEAAIADLRDLIAGQDSEDLVDVHVGVEEPAPAPAAPVAAAKKREALEVLALMDESADELALFSEALEKKQDHKILRLADAALEDGQALLNKANEFLAVKEVAPVAEDVASKEAAKLLDEALKVRAQNRERFLKSADEKDFSDDEFEVCLDEEEEECFAEDGEECYSEDAEIEQMLEDAVGEVVQEDKLARKRKRDSLVAEALSKYTTEKTFFQAHPGGKGTMTELTHTKTPEANVETIEEIHAKMRDVAEAGPRNVREAAAMLQEAIVKGAFKASDVEMLVSKGKVDADAAAYWKKYFGMATEGGSEFGAAMSKEFGTKKKEAADKQYKVKLRRAYDLGLEAQGKGFIEPTRASLDNYVDGLMEMDDAAFESTKRIVASMRPPKKTSGLPRVTSDAATEPMGFVSNAEAPKEQDLIGQLGNLGWK